VAPANVGRRDYCLMDCSAPRTRATPSPRINPGAGCHDSSSPVPAFGVPGAFPTETSPLRGREATPLLGIEARFLSVVLWSSQAIDFSSELHCRDVLLLGFVAPRRCFRPIRNRPNISISSWRRLEGYAISVLRKRRRLLRVGAVASFAGDGRRALRRAIP